MKSTKKLRGTGVAITTPFHKDGSINFKGFKKLIEHLIAGKVDYLVPLGTTGESGTLTRDEKIAVLDFVVEVVDQRVPVVAGVGGNNTQEVLKCLSEFDLSGVDAILSVTPYYNKPSQKGLYQHYKMIVNESPVPVILYNVPGRTGCNMLPETTLNLANDFENVIGVKEASGNMEQIMDLIHRKPVDFLIISGDDGITLPILAAGGDGVISVVGNAFPHSFSAMVQAAMNNDMDKARELHYLLFPIIPMLFAEGNPAGIKECTASLGITQNTVRLPLVNVSDNLKTKIIAQTSNICKAFPYDLIKK